MTNRIDVSVIIPNYNCLAFLPECLSSIDAQQVSNIEVIVVDDGSTDGSQKWLKGEQKKRPNLIVLYESKLGPGGARNVAAQVAQGSLIAFLDADDRWLPGKLAAQLSFHNNHPDTVLSFSNYQHIDEHTGQPIVDCFSYWPEFKKITATEGNHFSLLDSPSATIFKENIIGTSSVVCRRDAYLSVHGFDNQLPSASDWDLWLKLAAIGSVAYTPVVYMDYLVRQGSVSSNYLNRIQAMNTIAQRHLRSATLESKDAGVFFKVRLADAYSDMYLANRQNVRAALHSIKGLLLIPSYRRIKQLLKSTKLALTW